MTRRNAQRWLTAVWGGAAILLILLLFVQDLVSDVYGDQGGVVWKWLLSAIGPTVTLMVGAMVASERNPESVSRSGASVGYLYGIAMVVSILFLMITTGILILAAIRFDMAVIQRSEFIMEWLKVLAALVLGYFFVKESAAPSVVDDASKPAGDPTKPVRAGLTG